MAKSLQELLAYAVNDSVSKEVFPDNVNVASVSPADKQSNDKNKISNFRRVSVQIYESVIKNQFTLVLNNIFSPYIAVYRESYNTQHVLTCTAQKMKFSIKGFFSKCDQIRRKLRIRSHLLKKSLMVNFIFCAVVHSSDCLKNGEKILIENYVVGGKLHMF